MPEADPDDVRVEYGTRLEDPEIQPYIDRAHREVERHAAGVSGEDRRDLEAALAAYWIATRSADRAETSTGSGRSSVDYDTSVVDEIRKTIENLDPSGNLPPDTETIHFRSH